MIYERLGDSERREIENKIYWMKESDICELEEKYGEKFGRISKKLDFDSLSTIGKIVGKMILTIGFGCVGTEIFSAVDLYHGPTIAEKIVSFGAETLSLWSHTLKPALVSILLFGIRFIGISMIGYAGYQGAKEIRQAITIKINGNEIK